jgi:hypothetical protein
MKMIAALQKNTSRVWLVLGLVLAGLLACDAPSVHVRGDDAALDASETETPSGVDGQGDPLAEPDLTEAASEVIDDAARVEPTPEVAPPDAVPEAEATPETDADAPDAFDVEPGDASEQVDADEAIEPAEQVDPPDQQDGEVAIACAPDHDGVLAADEVQVAVGASITYTVNGGGATVSVPDLAGAPCEAGLCWDLSAPQAADEIVVDEVAALSGEAHWFAPDFADLDDAVVIPLNPHEGTLGVYRKTDEALWLVGMVSEAPQATSLRYDPPVPLVRFPLAKFVTYEVEAEAAGLYDGDTYPNLYGVQVVHRYHFVVDGEGALTVPAGTFEVLRLSLDLTMEIRNALGVPFYTERYKVIDFLAECLGLVARLRSTEGEMDPFFGVATEYKRLGF